MLKHYPFIRQEDVKDCGPTCLKMILKYYHGNMSMEELRDKMHTSKFGTTAFDIIEVAREVGFSAEGIRVDITETNADFPLPLIAHVIFENSYKHYVVIYEVRKKKKELLIADPAKGIYKMSFEDFHKIFSGIIISLIPVKPIPYYSEYSLLTFIKNTIIPYKNILSQILLLSVLVMVLSIVTSFSFQYMMEAISFSSFSVTLFFLFFFLLQLFRQIGHFFRNQFLIWLHEQVNQNIFVGSFLTILKLPYSDYRKRSTGDLVSRLQEVATLCETISKVLLLIFLEVPLMLISGVCLFRIHSTLFSFCFLLFLLYGICLWAFHIPLEKRIGNMHKEKAEIHSFMVEAISGFETLKGLHLEKEFGQTFERKYASFSRKNMYTKRIFSLLILLKDSIYEIGNLFLFYLGCQFVIKGEMTIGSLLTFSSLTSYFLSFLQNMIDFSMDLKNARISVRRILEIQKEEKDYGTIKELELGHIEVKNLSYQYDAQSVPLKNLSFQIKKGSKVMIRGKSGCGKSTLFQLLKKYYPLSRGQLFISGVDLFDIAKENIDQKILMISQNEIVFGGSVLENLMLHRTVDQKKLLKIVDICEIEPILDKQLGLYTIMEENGFNFSGGERQRIILARALLQPFDILIIDEGLNQTDIALERRILKRLFSFFPEKTIIMVSHRKTSDDLFHQVITFEKQKGKHIYGC